jgi:peroxiredoxin
MKRTGWTALLVVVLLVGVWWIWLNRITGDTVSTPDALPPAPALGHPAPDFTLTSVSGEKFKLSALRGTPVVLNFWATWCPPCRAELPELQAASERLAGQVAIIGVNQGEDGTKVRAFASDLGLTFEMPLDERAAISQTYGARSLPTTFFIDRTGVIRRIQIGGVTEATLTQFLQDIYP